MFGQIDEIKNLAFKYSKQQLGNMAQNGLIDTQKAVLAAMMRDRVAKEDTKPPTTTVAQDVLPPQQMGMPQEAPVQMAATGGITSLPVHEQDYAGGGIVAFADGGDTDDGVTHFDSGGFNFPAGSLFGMYERRPTAGGAAMDELQKLDEQIAQTPPGPMRDRMIQTREFAASKAAKANTQQFPSGIIATPDGQPATASGVDTITNPFNTDATATGVAAAPGAPKASVDKAPAGGAPATPRLPALNRPSGKIDIQEYSAATPKTIDEIIAERQETYKKQGIEDPYKGMSEKVEKKREELGTRKDQAKGEFLMNLGLGLTQSSRGQELAGLGKGAMQGMAAYKDAMKDVRATEEKLDERLDAYKLAKYQADKTGTDAAIAKRDSMLDKVEAAKAKNIDARNAANAKEAEIGAHLFGTETQANTARYVAQLQASTQRDYTAALKAQGLDVQRQKVLIEAAGDYISKNAQAPAYINKPELLQADAIAYSKKLAAEMGVSIPGGGNQTATPSNRPSLSSFQRQPT